MRRKEKERWKDPIRREAVHGGDTDMRWIPFQRDHQYRPRLGDTSSIGDPAWRLARESRKGQNNYDGGKEIGSVEILNFLSCQRMTLGGGKSEVHGKRENGGAGDVTYGNNTICNDSIGIRVRFLEREKLIVILV